MSDSNLQEWVVSHNSDYGRVRDRLEAVRNVVLRGRLDAAAKVLERSYMFAVLSIQTERDRHERAFVAHYAGELSRKEACLETVYGGNKKSWVAKTFDSVDWETLVLAVRSHVRAGRYGALLDAVDDNLTGVAHRKGAFMLAMCGLYEFMCIDSNVARYGGFEESANGGSLSFSDAQAYFEACEEIQTKAGIGGLPPFLVQWAIYDFERGEHARHMAYFREVLPSW